MDTLENVVVLVEGLFPSSKIFSLEANTLSNKYRCVLKRIFLVHEV